MLPTVEDLIQDAGVDAELGEVLKHEQISVAVLVSSSLGERREVLRALGCSYGALLAINRVLETYRKQELSRLDQHDDNEAEPGEGDSSGSEAASDLDAREESGHPDINMTEPVPPPASMSVPPPVYHSAQLQAAAMLLNGAPPHTLRALQTYLSNVLNHPEKLSFRKLQLSNPLFHERVWGVRGGASLLRAAGFVEDSSHGHPATVELAPSASLQPVRNAKDAVEYLIATSAKSDWHANPESTGLRGTAVAAAFAAASSATPGRVAYTQLPNATDSIHGVTNERQSRDRKLSPEDESQQHRSALQMVCSADGLLENAHTRSWDAALGSSTSVRSETLSRHEIRCCRACNQGRIAALLGRITNRLWELSVVDAATVEQASVRHRFLNALRMVTVLMPVLYEDAADPGLCHLLWTPLAKPPLPQAAVRATAASSPVVRRLLHTVGGSLVHGVLLACFVRGFTSVEEAAIAAPATTSGQQDHESSCADGLADGAGMGNTPCALPSSQVTTSSWTTSSELIDEARVECMRALVSCISVTLYLPPSTLSEHPSRVLLSAASAAEPYGKALFRGLLSVVFSYDPVGWGIPYSAVLLSDSHGVAMGCASQLLVALLSQPDLNEAQPSGGERGGLDQDERKLNKIARMMASLQKPDTFDFLLGGFCRLLGSRVAAENSYLPSSVHLPECEEELVILLFQFLSLNSQFVGHVLGSPPALLELLVAVAHLIFTWIDDASSSSMVQLCMLSLLLLSSQADFATIINERCPATLPAHKPYATEASSGCIGDLLLGCVAAIILHKVHEPPAVSEPLLSIYPTAVAVLSNLSPHVKTWSPASTTHLFDMVETLASPRHLFSSPAGPEPLISLVDAIATSLQYTHQSNSPLLHGLLVHANLLWSLPAVTLPESASPANDFIFSEEWLAAWKLRLPLGPIFVAVEAMRSKVSTAKLTSSTLSRAIQAMSLSAILPPPAPLSVRRYQPSVHSQAWMTQMVWGVIYSRNQLLHDAHNVRLVQIMQLEE